MIKQLIAFFLLRYFTTVRWNERNRSRLNLAHEVYCPDPTLPTDSSIFLSKRDDLPPLIYHITADKNWNSLKAMIQDETGLKISYIDEIMEFGGVYLEQPQKLSSKAPKSMKRILTDCSIKKDFYCRVHVNPRRYFLSKRDWLHHILSFDHGRYLVVNKPPGLPTAENIDNRIENTVFQVNKFLSSKSCKDSYIPTSRLDSCTGGLLTLANSSSAAANYHNLMKDQRIKKFYKALTYSPVQLGLIQHLFPKSSNGRHSNAKPTLLRNVQMNLNNDDSNWQIVELIALESKIRTISRLRPTIQHQITSDPFNPNPSQDFIYENYIQLITGKTHQIRLQLAALGHAIIGDSRYQPVNGLVDEGPLTSHGDGSLLFGREPKSIMLECHRLEIPRELTSFEEITSNSNKSSLISSSLDRDKIVFSLKRSFWEE